MDVQEELDGVLPWVELLLILFYSGCTTTSLQSYDLPEYSMVT